MKKLIFAIITAVAIGVAVSCSDGSSIGNSLTEETIIITVDSNFTVTGFTQANPVVQSRTLRQLIGNIEAEGFGQIYSDFVGQFMPSLEMDTTDIVDEKIDSVRLYMQMTRGDFIGDSLAPMGLTVYRLTKDLPYPIYSDFDPEGYYEPNDKMCETIFTASSMNEPDSLQDYSVVFTAMNLPVSFGEEIFRAFKSNPQAFANPDVFAKDVFKGLYIKSSYGSGRITDFNTTSIRFYFHKEVYNADSARYDTTLYVGDYLAVTPEVVVNNNIRYNVAPSLAAMVEQGEQILAAPAGYEVEMRFPAPELIASYKNGAGKQKVLNTLIFSIPVEEIANNYGIAPPPYVLMVLKNEKEAFFAENSLADEKTSFYAVYDETNECYTFTDMREYLLYLLSKEEVTEDDYTFVITPVDVNTESSASGYYGSTSVVSSIVPYVSKPAMGKLLLEKAKIKLTFSSNTGNFL